MFHCTIQEICFLAETSVYLLRVNTVHYSRCNFDVSNDITLGYALQVCAIELWWTLPFEVHSIREDCGGSL